MPIVCSEREISSRTNKISKLLLPLTNYKVAASRAAAPSHTIIIGVYSGTKMADKYKDWRFKTRNKDFLGNYFEIWSQKKDKEYQLEKSYLKILSNNNEILSLHCDPTILSSDNKYKYKCGPHIHIKHPINEAISNAHISLNLRDFIKVIDSLSEFERSYKLAIEMIRDEFL